MIYYYSLFIYDAIFIFLILLHQTHAIPFCTPNLLHLSETSKNGRWYLLPDGSMKYELAHCKLKEFTSSQVKQCFEGVHLVMMGDSLTRYLYLTFAYFLKKGSWPTKFALKPHYYNNHLSFLPPPSIIWEQDFANYLEFFQESNKVLNDNTVNEEASSAMKQTQQQQHSYEICDCYRNHSKKATWDDLLNSMFEVRHFRQFLDDSSSSFPSSSFDSQHYQRHSRDSHRDRRPIHQHHEKNDTKKNNNKKNVAAKLSRKSIELSYFCYFGNIPVRGHQPISFYPKEYSLYQSFIKELNQKICPANNESFIPMTIGCSEQRIANGELKKWDFPSFSSKQLSDCEELEKKPETNECQRFEREILQKIGTTHLMMNLGWHSSLLHQHPLFLQKVLDSARKYFKDHDENIRDEDKKEDKDHNRNHRLKLAKVIWRSCTFGEPHNYDHLVREMMHENSSYQDQHQTSLHHQTAPSNLLDYFDIFNLTKPLKEYSEAFRINQTTTTLPFLPHPTLFPKELLSSIGKNITFYPPFIDRAHVEPWVNSEIWNLFFNAVCV